jgi:hypothetical protein
MPGNEPKLHVVPDAHSVVDWPVEQQVSAHMVPAQSPERQSALAEHVAPPMLAPSFAERASHPGWTQ